jgi:hypothetical protein
MRRRISVLVSLLTLSTLVLAAGDASAQWYRRYRRTDVDRSIKQAERTSNEFVRVFDRNLDNSVLDRTEREDQLNEKARDLERKLDSLDQDFQRRGESWWESRETAADALQYARGINNSVRARRYTPQCERMWARLRADLNQIARYFNLPQLPR